MPPAPTLTRHAARQIVERFATRSILIVGDVMLDHFVVGRVNRISPEAPVPVVEFDHEEHRPGGAANVARNVRALGGRVALGGVIGSDAAAERLAALLGATDIGTDGLIADPSRPTTRKLRIVTARHQQVARVDYEIDRELDGVVEGRLSAWIDRAAGGVHAIVVSDYLKGAITRGVLARARTSARDRDVRILVDPKIPHLEYYAGAYLVTPNHHEAELATYTRIRTDADADAAAAALQRRAGCEHVLITRGEHGMWLREGAGPGVGLPAAAREVADVTGAGDTVIATLALSVAAGAPLAAAADLANHAAGIVVGRFGPATVSAEELIESYQD